MAEEKITFTSNSLKIAGTVRVPAGVAANECRPAFMVLHGVGSNSSSSEGPKGRLICLDQVKATSDALTFLARHPNVEPDRIGAIGSSFGAAVAVYTRGVGKR